MRTIIEDRIIKKKAEHDQLAAELKRLQAQVQQKIAQLNSTVGAIDELQLVLDQITKEPAAESQPAG